MSQYLDNESGKESRMFDKTGSRARTLWTLAITSVALFMVVLDNLVVSTALPVIRVDLGASIEELEWTVNAYTLTFAVFLLTGAALGDRFGRRRMFTIGIALFTVASAAAALAPSMDALIAARAVQGLGGALVMPLTLTILSDAFPAERRGVALGIWGAIGGIAIASGPLVGGAVIEGISWQWIFWLNVPVGIALVPLAISRLRESHGPEKALDLPGLAMPMVVAPIAGALSDRIGSRPILATGLALQAVGLAWIAAASTATVGYSSLVGPFIVSGIGMGMFFAPMANVILSSVSPAEEGKASGANNAVREVGGVFGVAVLASVFTRYGGYASPETFNDGLVVATWVGAFVVAAGALAALAIPRKKRAEAAVAEPALAEAA